MVPLGARGDIKVRWKGWGDLGACWGLGWAWEGRLMEDGMEGE